MRTFYCYRARVAFWLLALTLTLLALFPVHGQAGEQCQRLKVGVTIPLTGGLEAIGESFRNGILPAKREFDATGCVEFLIEDDQLIPTQTLEKKTWSVPTCL